MVYKIILPRSYTRLRLIHVYSELRRYETLLLSHPKVRREALEYFFANSVVEHTWRIWLDEVPRGELLSKATITHPQAVLGAENVVGGLSMGQYRLKNLALVFSFSSFYEKADIANVPGTDIAWAIRGPHVGFVIIGQLPGSWHSKIAKEGQRRLEKMSEDEKLEGMTIAKLMEVHTMMAGYLDEILSTSDLDDVELLNREELGLILSSEQPW